MSQKADPVKQRSQKGSILILEIFALALFIFLGCLIFWFNRILLLDELMQRSAESAALTAAIDLGRIVVNDPYFGYISLSDQPPTGKATLSADGQEQPVLGINTILASARLQTLIARESGNDDLLAFARQDSQAANQATARLCETLKSALKADNSVSVFDRDGRPVQVWEHARSVYLTNLGVALGWKPQLTDFRLSLGWLSHGTLTGIPVPQPSSLSHLTSDQKQYGEYKAGIDIPVGEDSFYFAGLGHQASLVDGHSFMPPDGKRTCSTVRVEAAAEISDANPSLVPSSARGFRLSCAAFAQPSAGEDAPNPGVLTLSFPDGYVPSLDSMLTLMTNHELLKHSAQVYQSEGGDYPYDQNTKLTLEQSEPTYSTAQLFAKGFHDWIRTAHTQVRIDSAVFCLRLPFHQLAFDNNEPQLDRQFEIAPVEGNPKNLFCFEITPEGFIQATRRYHDLYQHEIVTDDQECYLSCVNVNSDLLLLACQDYVSNIGTITGGKHAGRPLPPGKFLGSDLTTSFDKYSDNAEHEPANIACLVLGQESSHPRQSGRDHPNGLAVNFQISHSSLSNIAQTADDEL